MKIKTKADTGQMVVIGIVECHIEVELSIDKL